MSDILKSVSFIETDGDAAPASIPPEPVATDAVPVLRRAGDPMVPKMRPTPIVPEPEPWSRGLLWIGVALAILTALSLGAWAFGYFGADRDGFGPWEFAALASAVAVPTATVIALFAALDALRDARLEAARLAAVTERLVRADDTVAGEIATLADGIRREVAAVDDRLDQARQRLDGLQAAIAAQSRDLDATTKSMAERSETIGRALSLHRQAFESLTTTFDAQMDSLSSQLDQQRGRLGDTSEKVRTEIDAARASAEDAGKALSEAVAAAAGSSRAADASLDAARERMERMVARIQESASELDAVYERRTAHLASLEDRLSGERDGTEAALRAQTERLGAVDAQLEITEGRLTALVDHARTVHEGLMGQLSAIDATLDGADARSRAFTENLSGRVVDAVADARRDLSLMEADLRALQARLDTAVEAELDLPAPAPAPQASPGRVHLKPLDTDFPPVEPPRAPRRRRATDKTRAEDSLEAPLELVDVAEDSLVMPEPEPVPPASAPAPADVVQRPGGPATPGFGRAKPQDKGRDKTGGWRWRDMLGGIEPVDTPTAAQSEAPAKSVVRPPAGVPLTAPPPAPALPDGSDVVARLCEVGLAPSALVDDALVAEAAQARIAGGGAAVTGPVLARLHDPVQQLRGVLSADLEFRLKAQAFVRSMATTLDTRRRDGELQATLGTASGRAFLLCAAALSA